jgi:membrane-associated phospholipid phosphatase
MIQSKSNNHFTTVFSLSLLLTAIAALFVFRYGKFFSFQLINRSHNSFLDFFFNYFTHAGDGLVWLLPGLYCIFFNRKFLIAVVSGIVISTLLTHLLKRIIFPEEMRPVTYLAENFPVHLIEGVKMNRMNSFPSGHTATAFTIALLAGFMINKKIWACILPVAAFLVGYSRVYLAQHFATDVLAGMCVGIISAVLSIMIYREFLKRKSPTVK